MGYNIFLTYPGGSQSHKMKTLCRTRAQAHLQKILDDAELLAMAEKLTIRHSGRKILDIATSKPVDEIQNAIEWPAVGAQRKVKQPVAATLYMPEAVRDWLKGEGNGNVSAGFRKVMQKQNPALSNEWVKSK